MAAAGLAEEGEEAGLAEEGEEPGALNSTAAAPAAAPAPAATSHLQRPSLFAEL